LDPSLLAWQFLQQTKKKWLVVLALYLYHFITHAFLDSNFHGDEAVRRSFPE
jgi:hypothetical protein